MTNTIPTTPADIVAFWQDAGNEKWFRQSAEFDAEIVKRFSAAHSAAERGELFEWGTEPQTTAQSSLALVLLLDQFSRNIHRNSAAAFANDETARTVAEAAIARGHDAEVGNGDCAPLQSFFYMPFMHSEDLMVQARCITLMAACNNEPGLKWAILHADIIRRFGRFPHRNAVLKRTTTPQEQNFLDSGGFSG